MSCVVIHKTKIFSFINQNLTLTYLSIRTHRHAHVVPPIYNHYVWQHGGICKFDNQMEFIEHERNTICTILSSKGEENDELFELYIEILQKQIQ